MKATTRGRRQKRPFCPTAERLEPRLLLAADSVWDGPTGGNTDYLLADNWSPDIVPWMPVRNAIFNGYTGDVTFSADASAQELSINNSAVHFLLEAAARKYDAAGIDIGMTGNAFARFAGPGVVRVHGLTLLPTVRLAANGKSGGLIGTQLDFYSPELFIGFDGDPILGTSTGSVSFQDSRVYPGATYVGAGSMTEGFLSLDNSFLSTFVVPTVELEPGFYEMTVGDGGKGTFRAMTSMANVGELKVGRQNDGTAELSASTMMVFGSARIAIWDVLGHVFVKSGSTFSVRDDLVVADGGIGVLEVDGASHADASWIVVGFDDAGTGLVRVAGGSTLKARDVALWGVGITAGFDGSGSLEIDGASRVEAVNMTLALGEGSFGSAKVNGMSVIDMPGPIATGDGQWETKIEGLSNFKTGKVMMGAGGGAGSVLVAQASNLTATGEVELGLVGSTTASVYDTSEIRSDTSAFLGNHVLVQGDGTIAALDHVETLGYGAIVSPGTSPGGVATFTFDTPLFDSTAGMLLLVDAPSPGATDHIHATGDVALGGLLNVEVGDPPAPWTATGGAGNWLHILSADGDLEGAFDDVNLPDIESLILPPMNPEATQAREWIVIYDRDDVTPDPRLLDTHASLTNQPWLGNGTEDVVIVIRDIPIPIGTVEDNYQTLSMLGSVLSIDPLGVLLNDYRVHTAELLSNPQHGQLTFNSDGSFVYVPTLGYEGIDTFQYRAFNTVIGDFTLPETVTIEVTYHHPGSNNDEYATTSHSGDFLDVPAVGVLANDYYADTAELVTGSGPSHGLLVFNSDGSFVYTPTTGYNGQDSFQYIAIDSVMGFESLPATVTINVSFIQSGGLLLDQPAVPGGVESLAMAQLVAMSDAAIARWRAAGVDGKTLADRLGNLSFEIVDLPGSALGEVGSNGQVLIDIDAAGHGWFVDTTPRTDREFATVISRSERQALRGSAAYDGADLLTAVMHELGHVLGLVHIDGDEFEHSVMHDTLSLSTRRIPTAADILAADEYYASLGDGGSLLRRRR